MIFPQHEADFQRLKKIMIIAHASVIFCAAILAGAVIFVISSSRNTCPAFSHQQQLDDKLLGCAPGENR